jgi:hypothetical protein
MSNPEIQVGDFVHATLYNQSNDAVLIQQFVVTEIQEASELFGGLYKGGEIDCELSNGWTVELIRKGLENLNLPAIISEIIATDKSGKTHSLIGKNTSWRDQDGKSYEVSEIVSWVPEA